MKQILAILLALVLLNISASARQRIPIPTAEIQVQESFAQDSLIRSVSINAKDDHPTFFKGVIPCSPQAASLARYAEYPVNHTTGIPDITIPLYEIKMGDFTLPITVSYHASGARPDEVPTCVGLGWTLNAGGAVTRTILGGPDMEIASAYRSDHYYYNKNAVDSLVCEISNHRGNGHLRQLTNSFHYRDSESDRYCYNAGGHTGIFRYSYKDRKFVTLDGSSCIFDSFGYGDESYFLMYAPDNCIYRFEVHEKTGFGPDEDDPYFTTGWYVSTIHTPYGEVNFTYRNIDDRFFVKHPSTYFRSGFYPKVEHLNSNLPAYIWYEFDIKKYDVPGFNTYFKQKLISSIEWNGNKVIFDYAPASADDLNMRLVSMTVVSSSGETLKTVNFGNDIPWKSGTDRGRRILRSIDDSTEGSYKFVYNTYNVLPNLISGGETAKYTDSWGFYNGECGESISKALAEWLRIDENNSVQYKTAQWKDRSPKLYYTQLGVLKTIRFPSGGSVSYTYELNDEARWSSCGIHYFRGRRKPDHKEISL